MGQSTDLNATLHFLARDPLYETVKPYTLHRLYMTTLTYDNFITDAVDGVAIRDFHTVEQEFSFEENGITVVDMESPMTYKDFNDPAKIEQIYYKEVDDALLSYIQAASVQIFDFAVGKPIVWQVC